MGCEGGMLYNPGDFVGLEERHPDTLAITHEGDPAATQTPDLGALDIQLTDDQGDITTGWWRWELIPLDLPHKTLLIHSLYYDIAESNWILRQFQDSNPTTEHGLNVSSGQLAIRALKLRAQQKHTPN